MEEVNNEVVEKVEKKKKASKWWRVGVFSLPLVWVLWFIVSLVFWLIVASSEPTGDLYFLNVVRWSINWVLWVLALISLPLTIVSIIMLARKNTQLAGKSIRFWWKWAKKTIWKWVLVLVLWAIWWVALTQWGASYTMPDPVALAEVEAQIAEWTMPPAMQALATMWVDSVVKPWKQGIYNARQVINGLLRLLFILCMTSASLSIVYSSVLKLKNFADNLNAKTMLYYVLGYILYVAWVLLWTILLIVPWIIIAMRWKFFDMGVLKEWLNPIKAIKHSRHLTKGHVWDLISLTVMQSAIQVLWILCVVVWLLWTIPTARIADVKAYEILVNWKEKE